MRRTRSKVARFRLPWVASGVIGEAQPVTDVLQPKALRYEQLDALAVKLGRRVSEKIKRVLVR